ncbi:MAG: glycoside hydrolase, partial [Burkholderiaceae bacterium]|nr:glycoside hydrolase [Burkholderiaceae bacterium]
EHWSVVEPFYNGSLYNALPLPRGGWLVYGMRGNVFYSDGDGASWRRSELPAQASFFGHATTPDGQIILVGQGSLVATSKDGGRRFTLGRVQGRANLTDMALVPDGTGWLASDAGLQAFSAATPVSTSSSSGSAQ